MNAGRILIVEDEPIVAGDIERTVKRLGYQVLGKAVSGSEALSLAAGEAPDVALLDIKLKGEIDGIQTGAQLKERFSTALIYLTAFSDQPTFDRAKITEPFGYIVKPFRETDLRIAIGLALYKKSQGAHFPSIGARHQTHNDELAQSVPGTHSTVVLDFLSSVDLFSTLSESEQKSIASWCHFQEYRQGDVIVCEGDEDSSCIIPESGRIALVKTSEKGKELVVELLFPKDLYHIVSAFEGNTTSLTARAQNKTRVLLIPRKVLFSFLSNHPEFYRIFVRESTKRLRNAHNMMQAMAHDRVETRIASTLSELSKRPTVCPSPEEGIAITRKEIADLTGTTIETAIRVTRSLEKRGVLELSKRGTVKITDPAELRQLASS